MKAGCLISLFMWACLIAAYVMLSGCSSLPSMKYCDSVSYIREGSAIHIEADCHAPVGGSIPGM